MIQIQAPSIFIEDHLSAPNQFYTNINYNGIQKIYFIYNLGISISLIYIPNIQTPHKGSCPCIMKAAVFLVIHFLPLEISPSLFFFIFPRDVSNITFSSSKPSLTSLHTKTCRRGKAITKEKVREKWGKSLQPLLPHLECTDPHQLPREGFWGLG